MLSKGKGFGNWLRLLGRHHTRAHWTRVYDLEQGAWLDSTQAIKYILSHQGTTKPIPAEAKEAASEAPTAGPNGKPGQNDVASPERNGKAPKAAPTPSDLDWASEAIQHLGAAYRDDYDQWLKVGLALAGLGSDGLAIWDDWSRQSPKYEEGCCVAKWSSFTPDHGLTLGSLYHWAKAEGWPGPSKIPAPAEGETAKPPCDKDYLTHDGVLCRWVPMKVKGEDDELEWQPVPLANFDARAVEEVAQTIGASARRVFLIRASRPQATGGIEHRERALQPSFALPAATFDCSIVC
jgi:Primase C terminal 2 (PriCT-2)